MRIDLYILNIDLFEIYGVAIQHLTHDTNHHTTFIKQMD